MNIRRHTWKLVISLLIHTQKSSSIIPHYCYIVEKEMPIIFTRILLIDLLMCEINISFVFFFSVPTKSKENVLARCVVWNCTYRNLKSVPLIIVQIGTGQLMLACEKVTGERTLKWTVVYRVENWFMILLWVLQKILFSTCLCVFLRWFRTHSVLEVSNRGNNFIRYYWARDYSFLLWKP